MRNRTPQRVMRVVLNRELIVHTAVELVEREGAEALSMRAIGAELGVTGMAMYNHVPGKEELLRGIAEYVMGTLELPEERPDDWRAGARDLAHAFRDTANEYPRCMALVVANKVGIPVGFRVMERALALGAAAGLKGADAVRVMRSLMAFIFGSQLREAGMDRMLGERPDDVRPVEPAEDDTDASFEFGLELFLSAIEMKAGRAG